jgi:RHH-type transcriptional regulator, proline utilization regulon repressor / proline dehydrogenase / delta 1-pyrroline-5-carboxylate dehydrogenase
VQPIQPIQPEHGSHGGSETARLQELTRQALELAKVIQLRAAQLQTPAERRQQAELDRMLQYPEDKTTLTQLTDQIFRTHSAVRSVDQMIHILDVQGIPRFFSQIDRALLRGFQSFGSYLPGVAVPLVKDKMRKETANVILPADRELLRGHLAARREAGIRMNVNFLGEAILGEKEAQHRLEKYLAALQQPEIEVVSVKISTLYSQISPLAREHTLRVLGDRLELLYRGAARSRLETTHGPPVPKFVYLDMEEYRDMSLTSAAFMETLDRPGLEQVRAGIALQAYVPDSYRVQRQLTAWARRRLAAGGSPITIRIVKGANMEMERVEASLRGWPQAPYKSKLDTDANYKQMLLYGLQPEHFAAVRIGVASHNLFEVAFAMLAAAHSGVLEQVQFEMLEGMANHQRRALHEISRNLLLYAPACSEEDFTSAIGYLVRRLDENTGPDNFLRHAFKISVDSPAWTKLEEQFAQSVSVMAHVSDAPRRTQDRREPPVQPPAPERWQILVNEPDTDFSLPHNGQWGESILRQWQQRCDSRATEIPLTIAGREEQGRGALFESPDPSRPGVIVARYRGADAEQLKTALTTAVADPDGWRTLSPTARYAVLRNVAQRLRERRADLLGAALADAGKTLMEGDPEVSEAIDFVEFYARTALDLQTGDYRSTLWRPERGLCSRGRGVVAVISPWNFPIAIPCGGIAAALAAGNTVLLKPASDTVLPARILCECFWEAGVSRHALQFIPCAGRVAGESLLTDPRLQTVILTGGTATAQQMLATNPRLHLLAETGGKNATIVTSLSDHDQAIKNVLHSAFSHAGQKCSATSLLLLEEEVFHDASFRAALIDAAMSLRVGSVWELPTKMGPLIRPPAGELLRGLKELETGEAWALMPRNLNDNPCLYTPGIKWGTRPGSFTHLTELFGPVLAVMPFRKLAEAIEIVHQTGYGLTSGLESLDDREQELWASHLRAGNLYINRPTTGAIVVRQPFGGLGKSAFGPGSKAGGPNYVVPLMEHPTLRDAEAGLADRPATQTNATSNPVTTSVAEPASLASAVEFAGGPHLPVLAEFWRELHDPHHPASEYVRSRLSQAGWRVLCDLILDYDGFAQQEIRGNHDALRLVGQDNIRRYLPMTHIRIRVTPEDTAMEIVARAVAAMAAGGRAVVSHARGIHSDLLNALELLTHAWAGSIEFLEEDDAQLVKAIAGGQVDRLRYAAPGRVTSEIRRAADAAFVYVAEAPVSPCGRVELLWYVQEQSLSVDYHRYGNLGMRASEPRAEPL